jgi:hypothetical protein
VENRTSIAWLFCAVQYVRTFAWREDFWERGLFQPAALANAVSRIFTSSLPVAVLRVGTTRAPSVVAAPSGVLSRQKSASSA